MTALKAVPLEAPGTRSRGEQQEQQPLQLALGWKRGACAASRSCRGRRSATVEGSSSSSCIATLQACRLVRPESTQRYSPCVPDHQIARIPPVQPTATTSPATPTPAGVWAEQRADDGRRYYWNKFTNTSKWELSEEEKTRLVPNLDSYDNPMVMSLQVGAQ